MIQKRVNGIINELLNIVDYLQVVSNSYDMIKFVGRFVTNAQNFKKIICEISQSYF